MSYGFLPGHIR